MPVSCSTRFIDNSNPCTSIIIIWHTSHRVWASAFARASARDHFQHFARRPFSTQIWKFESLSTQTSTHTRIHVVLASMEVIVAFIHSIYCSYSHTVSHSIDSYSYESKASNEKKKKKKNYPWNAHKQQQQKIQSWSDSDTCVSVHFININKLLFRRRRKNEERMVRSYKHARIVTAHNRNFVVNLTVWSTCFAAKRKPRDEMRTAFFPTFVIMRDNMNIAGTPHRHQSHSLIAEH